MIQRWKRRPPGSNWGEFGPDDQIGRLNLLTAKKVKQGAAEIEQGMSFSLSLPLDFPGGSVANPRRRPPQLFAASHGGTSFYNHVIRREDGSSAGVISDDAVLLHTQYSTQWDGFAHFGAEFDADDDGIAEMVYYNGWPATSLIGPGPGSVTDAGGRGGVVKALALGVEHMAAKGIQGRGVLLDLHAHFGREHRRVTFADLCNVMNVDEVVVEPGDILCIYTGFDEVLIESGGNPDAATIHKTCCGLDGADPDLLQWITQSNIAAIASDNRAVEMLPLDDSSRSAYAAPLHAHCLFKLGVPLGEMWFLSELAKWLRANRRSRFLLTAPPLRLPGAIGSPVTPVATV